MSEEQKKKIGDANRGMIRSAAIRERMSVSRIGKPAWNKGKKNPENCNERNKSWRGDLVGKCALHAWVRRRLGTPKKCELCGTETAKIYDWANKDHKYRRNLEDFIRLCRPCHRRYDIDHNNYTNPTWTTVNKTICKSQVVSKAVSNGNNTVCVRSAGQG